MIPSGELFLAGIRFYARRHGLPSELDAASVEAALAEARGLAVVERDEPAALFMACARRSRSFAGAAGRVIPFVVRRQAASIGLELEIGDLELEILRARVLLGAIVFEELRARFESACRSRPPQP